MMNRLAVVGLGYVGLPLVVALARVYPQVVGFDVNDERIRALKRGEDRTREVKSQDLLATSAQFTSDEKDLGESNFFIVTVPTPIDEHKNPDLEPLRKASEIIGRYLQIGAVVVYESTVYPGVTEEFCAPILERVSGLKSSRDFFLGYSPERINPGDRVHSLENVVKVVAGQDELTLDRVAGVYESIVTAGVFRAASIKAAEAAKVIENTQRDLNIALMNELALIFDRMDLSTNDVLAAAKTKWNFLAFTPGLVGGHCIGVDPYYLTHKAEALGYHPQVILSGRRVNDGMGNYVAQKMVKLLIGAGAAVQGAKVVVMGLTFKENVPDLRNSRVPDIVAELEDFGVNVLVHDPIAFPEEAKDNHGITLTSLDGLDDLDGVVLAVPHSIFVEQKESILKMLKPTGVLVDVRSVYASDKNHMPLSIKYWSL